MTTNTNRGKNVVKFIRRIIVVLTRQVRNSQGGYVKRVKSGILGFDKMVGGGIPAGSVMMVSGGAGAGKTIFALQTLCSGAKNGERGLFITFEENPDDIINQGKQFDWNIDGLLKKGTLRVIRMTYPKIKDNGSKAFEKVLGEWRLPKTMADEIIEAIRKSAPKRVVIDSLATLGSGMRSNISELMKRDIIKELIFSLKQQNLELTVLTSELPRSGDWYSTDGYSEFLVDGIILVHKISSGMGVARMISVEKMRMTNHTIEKFPMFIEDGAGVVIKSPEETMK